MKPRRSHSFLILSLLLTGCAFGTRRPELLYPPEVVAAEASMPIEAAVAPERTVILAPLVDSRSETNVGEVRNGFGMKTASVVTETSVPDWVHDALHYELERAGYTVLDEPASVPGAITLEGEILTVYCKAFFSYEAEVSLLLTARRGSETLFRTRTTGSGSVGTNWGASSKSYGKSLALALQDALGKLVAELRGHCPAP